MLTGMEMTTHTELARLSHARAWAIQLLLLFLVWACATPPSAQVLGRTEGRIGIGTGYYVNALPNEPTIRVYVRGDVPRTGIYDLGGGFTVESLVALAGAPTAADLDPRDPTVFVRVYRDVAGVREVAYQADYLRMAAGDEPAPQLNDGDVIEVETVFERGLYVWGAVRNPGYFEVGPAVDAVRLLALAGGPQGEGARAADIVNDATVAVVRPGAGTVYQASLESFVAGEGVPALRDGDALQVEVVRRNKVSFLDVLQTVGAVSAVVVVVFRLVDAIGGGN